MKKKIMNKEITKKSVMLGICMMLMISLLPVSVMGQCGPGGCPVPSGGGGGNVNAPQNPTINDFVTDSPDEDIGSQNEKYYDTEKDEITSSPANSNGVPNSPLDVNNMETAKNLKQLWNNIPDNLRKDFLMKNPVKVSELDANQLTLSNNLRDLIRDKNNPKIWEEITKNSQKAIKVLENMGYNVDPNSNLQGWKWDVISAGEESINTLKYGNNGPEIVMDLTKGYEITFNNGNAIVINLKTNYPMAVKGDMRWTPIYDQSLAKFNPSASPVAAGAGDFGGPSGGGGGSAGGGGGGGGIEQSFQEAFQVAQQMVQLAQSLLGPLAESMKSNGKGKTSVSGPNEFGGVTAELEDGAGIALNKNGEDTLLALNEDGKSVVKTKKDEEETELENVDFLVPKQLAGEVEQTTTLQLAGTEGNSPSNPPSSSNSEIPEVGSSGTVYTLFFPGRDINVYALKTFEDVEAGGQNIKIFSGDIEIKIEGQRIMYPRLVKNAPYGFAQLSNKLDQENKFRLQHYEDKKGIFYDGQQITSIGDITTNHPKQKLMISKVREDMWKN